MLGTSKGSVEMLEYAKSQGIYTIVTDYLTPEFSKGKQIADEYWMINTADIDELVEKCEEGGVDGVCCGLSTFNVPQVSKLASRLGLPSYATEEAWHYTVDKYDFKKLCKECGVPVAKDYAISENPTDDELGKVQLPVMVKAVDLSSNKGMSYCYEKNEIAPAIKFALESSASDKFIVERMLEGKEYTAYYCLKDGKASLVSLFSDLNQSGYPNKCYALNSTACNKLDLYKKEIDPYFKKFMNKSGMKNGVCFIEMILDKDGHFYVLEMGYRLSGDMMAIPIKDVTGFDSYKWLVDFAMGDSIDAPLPVEIAKPYDKIGCSYIIWSKDMSGTIDKIKGVKEISALDGVKVQTQDNLIFEGSSFDPYVYLITFTFTRDSYDEICETIKFINDNISITDTNGNDICQRFTDFNELYTEL